MISNALPKNEKSPTRTSIRNISEDDVYRMFFPDRNQLEDLYEQPNYEYVHGELKRTGVTLKLLWQEYQDKCASLTKIHNALFVETGSMNMREFCAEIHK